MTTWQSTLQLCCNASLMQLFSGTFLHMRQNIQRTDFLFCLPLTQLMFQGFSFGAIALFGEGGRYAFSSGLLLHL